MDEEFERQITELMNEQSSKLVKTAETAGTFGDAIDSLKREAKKVVNGYTSSDELNRVLAVVANYIYSEANNTVYTSMRATKIGDED